MDEIDVLRNNVKQRFRSITNRLDTLENSGGNDYGRLRGDVVSLGRRVTHLLKRLDDAEERMLTIERQLRRRGRHLP